ncbi:MAG: metallophosphoesterase [Chloroflexi bacterium]|nr:metallophosphoesterase [Chloroflexota bacterium]
MLIGIISDTHDQVHYLPRVVSYYQDRGIEMLFHCGDWISPFTLQYFKPLDVPVYAVYGNNDGDKFTHQRVAQRVGLNLTMEDQLLTHTVSGKNLAIYHGTSPSIVNALIKCGDYDAVFYGHNHLAKIEQHGRTLAMNPGTLLDKTTEDVQGASFGLYDVVAHQGEIIWLTQAG